MRLSAKKTLRSVTISGDGAVLDERMYPSEDLERMIIDVNLRLIDGIIEPDETKTLTWKGYVALKTTEHCILYRIASFVLTERNMYVCCEDFSQRFISIYPLELCKSFCMFNEDFEYLPSFVIYFPDAVEFLYDPDSGLEWKLLKELHARKIHME